MADQESVGSFLMQVAKVATDSNEWTTQKQLQRLSRPGSKYFNLNPFEVLLITPDSTEAEIKKNFRKLSILIHPDKVDEADKSKAEDCFAAVNKAYKMLEDPEEKKTCESVASESRKRAEKTVKEKRKEAKKKLGIDNPKIEEDDPTVFEKLVKQNMCKIFAEIVKKKDEIEQREAAQRKREREEETAETTARAEDDKFKEKWTDGREDRIANWRNFAAGESKGGDSAQGNVKKLKIYKMTKAPGVKLEQRKDWQKESGHVEATVDSCQKAVVGWQEKLNAEKKRSAGGQWKGAW